MIVLHVADGAPADVLTQLRLIALRHPGPHTLQIVCRGRALTLGPRWGFADTPVCRAALSEFGELETVAC